MIKLAAITFRKGKEEAFFFTEQELESIGYDLLNMSALIGPSQEKSRSRHDPKTWRITFEEREELTNLLSIIPRQIPTTMPERPAPL